jgi:hypothetical protein
VIEGFWIAAAARLGFRVERTGDAYASTDGRGTLLIGVDDSLDGDDTVAQLVFHEICHAAVQGPSSWRLPDWGLSNTDERDVWREHACLRVQAALAAAVGLRRLMTPTTDYRHYYRALPSDPLGPCHLDLTGESAAAASATLTWFEESSWREPVEQALVATASEVLAAQPDFVPEEGPLHPLGFLRGEGVQQCGACAWAVPLKDGSRITCRQVLALPAQPKTTAASTPACRRWEPRLDCQACGACCREAYHSVSVSVRDPVVWKHPALVVRHGPRFEILREEGRCAALTPGAGEEPRWSCRIYDDRPRTCRDFTAGSRNCLEARRRVRLSA